MPPSGWSSTCSTGSPNSRPRCACVAAPNRCGHGLASPPSPIRRAAAMDPNRLTQKSQEALAPPQQLATRAGHTEVDGEHRLMALLEQSDGLVPRLLASMDVDL